MKAVYAITSVLMVVAFLTIVPNVGLSDSTEEETSHEGVTHLNVRVGNLVHLMSLCMPNDNSLNNQFFYDRVESAPFSIPEGFSFVVTDVIVVPNCGGEVPVGQNFFTIAVVEGPLGREFRLFLARFSGQDGRHFPFTGGIAYPAGVVPRPRNTPSSSGNVEIQLLGYFIRGTALAPGEPRF
jgi:hypothetical protein